ncbi:hypothetical protein ABPG74_010419 [Tetrahymena malaccensis]
MENEDEDEEDNSQEDEEDNDDDDDENDDDEDDNQDDDEEDDEDEEDEEEDDKSKSQEDDEDEEDEDKEEEEQEEEKEEEEEEIEVQQLKKKRGRKSKAEQEKMQKAKIAAEKQTQSKKAAAAEQAKKPGKKGRKKMQQIEEEIDEEAEQEDQDEDKSDQDDDKDSRSEQESMEEEDEENDDDDENENQDEDESEDNDGDDSDKDSQDKEDDEDDDKDEDDDMDDDDDNLSAGSDKSIRENEEEMEEEEDDQDGYNLQIDQDAFQVINKVGNSSVSIYRLTDFYRYSSKKVQKLILKELKMHTNMRNRVQKDNREYIEKQLNFSDRLLEEWRSHNQVQQFYDQVPDEANEEGNLGQQVSIQKSASQNHPQGQQGLHGHPSFQGKPNQNQKISHHTMLKKSDLNITQLESAIYEDVKASKSDYFLHFNNMKQSFQIVPQMIQRIYNPISSNEYFTQLRDEMIKKIISGENKFVPEEEEEDVIEDLYEKEYMRLYNGMRKDAKIKSSSSQQKKDKKSKMEDMQNQSDFINEDEDNDSYRVKDESDNNFMINDDSQGENEQRKSLKNKKGKSSKKNSSEYEDDDQDSGRKKKKSKKSKKSKNKKSKQEKRRKKDSNDSSISLGDDSYKLTPSKSESYSQSDSSSNEDSSNASNSSGDENSSGFAGSDSDSVSGKKYKNSKKGNNRKNSESMEIGSENEGKYKRKQKNENNDNVNSQEKSDSVILNAMSIEEREISRERNKNSDIQSINLLQIKQKKYKENCMDLEDKNFLENFFKFDYNNNELIQNKNYSESKSQSFQFKIGDESEKKQNLFGEPIDMEQPPPFAPNSKMFRITQQEKDFIHIEEPKQGNYINIQISSNTDKNKQKTQAEKDKQKEMQQLQQQQFQLQQQALQKDGNPAFINQQKKNLLAKTEKLPKETFVVKRHLISKQFDYYNSELLNCGWNQPKEHYNNILIDLNDPQFFLEKVNTFFSTQKKERKDAFYKWDQLQKKLHVEERGDTTSVIQKSIFSGLPDQVAQGVSEDQPSQFIASLQQQQQQYPVNLKTYIEQKKRDQKEIPQKYDHSRVAKQFEFNYLTQDENVFKDYHYWDLFQKIRIAQRQFDKQYQDYIQYLNTIQSQPPGIPLLQQQQSQSSNTITISTPKLGPQQPLGMPSATALGGSGLIQMQLPPIHLSSQQSQSGQPTTPTSTPSTSRPIVQQTQSLNKISIKMAPQTKDTIVSIPFMNQSANQQAPGAQQNPSNPTLITIQNPLAGKNQSSSIISLTTNASSDKSSSLQKDRKDKNNLDKIMAPQIIDQTKQPMPLQRQPPIKNPMLNEWKSIPIGMQPTDYCLKTINPDMKCLEISEEKVESYNHFKSKRNLSLKKDVVIMMEYIEEDPLVLQNIGMNSKIFRYAYHNRIFKKIENDSKKQETLNQINQQSQLQQQANESMDFDKNYKTIGQFQSYMHRKQQEGQLVDFEKELQKFKQYIQDYLGELGRVVFYDDNDKTNLFGQLDDQEEGKESLGITVLENHLFKAPIFKQRLPETDFLLVRQQENDKCNYYLRPIEYVYVVGQIEPSKSIYRPRSRDITPYMKNCMNTFIMIKIQKEKKVHFQDLLNNFSKNLTETQIRQQIKKKNLKPELNNKNTFVPKDNDQDSDNENAHDPELTPEQACMFEKMLSHVYHLSNEIGLKELRTTEKLKNVLAKFQRDYPEDIKNYTIAKLITDKLSLTPWSLSNNFAHDKQKLYLEGLGDPTNGHGGYSFIKRPLKKRSEKDEKQNNKEDEKQKEDLRKLNISEINNILQKLGINQDTKTGETKKQRWAKIEQIKKKLDEIDLTEREDLLDLAKFKRKDRKTVKEAEQHYQKKINSLFHILIQYLSEQDPPEVPPEVKDDDVEYLPLDYYMEEEKKIREKKKKQLKMQKSATPGEGNIGDQIYQSEEDGEEEEDDEDEEDEEEEEQGDDSMSDQG